MARVLLLSTYELGRQPFGLASPAAWLRDAGCDVAASTCRGSRSSRRRSGRPTSSRSTCRCTPRRGWPDRSSRACGRSIPRRVSAPTGSTRRSTNGPARDRRVRRARRGVRSGPRQRSGPAVASRSHGSDRDAVRMRAAAAGVSRARPADAAGADALRAAARRRRTTCGGRLHGGDPRLPAPVPALPDRADLRGQIRVVPVDIVLADVGQQVAAGAQHITFGDPDFFNGPTHARRVIVGARVESIPASPTT